MAGFTGGGRLHREGGWRFHQYRADSHPLALALDRVNPCHNECGEL